MILNSAISSEVRVPWIPMNPDGCQMRERIGKKLGEIRRRQEKSGEIPRRPRKVGKGREKLGELKDPCIRHS